MALKDEILALIASKIEGQGTAVDAGSALPGILRGIIEYVDGIAAGIPAAQIQSDWTQADNTKVDFIKNKPTIPAAQIQSDWSQVDNTKLDFIKNKPTIPAGTFVIPITVAGQVATVRQGGPTNQEIKEAIQNGRSIIGHGYLGDDLSTLYSCSAIDLDAVAPAITFFNVVDGVVNYARLEL